MSKPAAIGFEAKLYALRKSKDGLILSFVIHPSDIPQEIITADIGEQYMVACAPYVEEATATVVPIKEPKTEGELAVQKAWQLAEDTRFQLWASKHIACMGGAFPTVADFIRHRCAVKSCKEFHTNASARQRFWGLVDSYEQEMGLRPEVRS